MTCVVVSYFGVWGSAPTRAGVIFVGSCRTCPHTTRRLAGTEVDLGRPSWGRYVSCPTLTAQAVRAILLASATATTFGGLVAIIRCSQGDAARGFRRACRNTAMAPVTSNARRSRCPILVMYRCGAVRRAVLSRRDPDPGGKFPTVLEMRHVRRIGGQRKCRDGSDAGNRHQAPSGFQRLHVCPDPGSN